MASLITRKHEKHEKRLTIMMMVIVLVFGICNSFYGAYYIFRDQGMICKIQKTYLYPTACVFLVLNSSVNVFIYGAFNKKFKSVFISLFLPCINQKEDFSKRESSQDKKIYLTLRKVSLDRNLSPSPNIYDLSVPPQFQREVSTEPIPLTKNTAD